MNPIRSSNEPGFAILAFKNGKHIQPVCSGMANLRQKTPITPLTNFRMASVSKQFTAMTVLILSGQEKLRLDDTLNHFFSPCHKNLARMTLWQLLTHTSGIRDYEDLIPPTQTEQVLDEDVWTLVNRQGQFYFPPGKQFRYSNTGYCILALVASKISGLSFPQTVKRLLFDPLAMSGSLVYEPGCEIPHRALGYIPEEKSVKKDPGETEAGEPDSGKTRSSKTKFVLKDQSITSATKGDGGVYTSLTDYLKWHEALYTEKLIPEKLLREAFSARTAVNNGIGYGYGWFSGKETDGSRCQFHSGETSGFLNMVYRNPSKKLLIAIFSNRNDGSISGKFEETARQLGVNVNLTGFTNGQQPPLFNWLSEQY